MLDVRFATTLQMMLSLALAHEEGVPRLSSAQLAEGAGANPSLVRRLLPSLAKAGLIISTFGRDGGVALARPAAEITFQDVHEAVIGRQPMWRTRCDIPHRCVVSSNIDAYLTNVGEAAERAVATSLAGRTLAGGLEELRRLNGRRSSGED
jgi:Rrf2 family transcriptional regulator, repressor of oqxAB